MEGYFTDERSVILKFGPTVAVGLVHLVGAAPVEGDGFVVAGAAERAGDAPEGELAFGLAEVDVGGNHPELAAVRYLRPSSDLLLLP